jgi:hypothetical protein
VFVESFSGFEWEERFDGIALEQARKGSLAEGKRTILFLG